MNTTLRKSITIRTYEGWQNPPPGYFAMHLMAHCGSSVAGSIVHRLVLTDIASGWTEAAALIVREQTLIMVALDEIQARLPFSMLGLDVDNDSAFINEVLLSYGRKHNLELTRSRAYKKNDQAWIEQKNGAIMRKLVGHGGADATLVLADLHKVARLSRHNPRFRGSPSRVRPGVFRNKIFTVQQKKLLVHHSSHARQ